MRLFSKNAPTKCPKCGKSDGWRCVTDDTAQSNAANAGMGNPFYLDSSAIPSMKLRGTGKARTRSGTVTCVITADTKERIDGTGVIRKDPAKEQVDETCGSNGLKTIRCAIRSSDLP